MSDSQKNEEVSKVQQAETGKEITQEDLSDMELEAIAGGAAATFTVSLLWAS